MLNDANPNRRALFIILKGAVVFCIEKFDWYFSTKVEHFPCEFYTECKLNSIHTPADSGGVSFEENDNIGCGLLASQMTRVVCLPTTCTWAVSTW